MTRTNIGLTVTTAVLLLHLVWGAAEALAQEFSPTVLRVPDGANALVCQPATLGQGTEAQ